MKLSLILLSLITSLAMAESGAPTTSYYQHQALKSSLELSNAIQIQSQETNYLGEAKVKEKSLGGLLAAEYGLTDSAAIGVTIAYDSTTSDASTTGGSYSHTSKGSADPQVYVKFHRPTSMGDLFYGGNFSMATEAKKVDATGNSNASSGGAALTPFVGFERNFDLHTIGARAAYKVWIGERKIEDDAYSVNSALVYIDEKLSGGNLLTSTVFYEYRMSTITVGLAGELQKIEAQTKTYDQEQSANTSPEVEPANAKLLARLYLPVQLTSNLMIQPSLEYASYYDFDKDNIKSINESKGEINIRYAF